MRSVSKIYSLLSVLYNSIFGKEQEYTSGNINKAIILLSFPMVLEMVGESLFAVVDVYFVSHLNSNEAVAAVGLTEAVLTLVYSIAFGISMAATAVVARRVGEKKTVEANVAGVQAIYLGIALWVVMGLLGFIFAEDILLLLGRDEKIVAIGVNYTRWMFAGNISIMLLFIINAIFRGAGVASLAMASLWLSNGLNIILDPMFIYGFGPIPAFGVEGAAIATNIGRSVGVLLQLYFLFRGKSVIKIRWEFLKVKWDIIRELIRLSAGGAGQFIIASSSWICLMSIMSTFGAEVVAGYTMAIRVVLFTILPAWGMANAAATLVGQNLGAGKPDRAEASVWRAALYNMIFMGMVSIFFLVMAEDIISQFTKDLLTLMYGTQCLQIVCLGYIFYAYGMVICQSFNGAGDTKTPTILNFFGFWTFQIPLAYFLAIGIHLGPIGVFAAIPIAESVLAIVSVLVFRKGNWKKTIV